MSESPTHTLANVELTKWYRARGFGGRVGFGTRPALIVIDMAKAWLDTETPLGSEAVQAILPGIVALLDVARSVQIPIFFTTMEFDDHMLEAGRVYLRKHPHLTWLRRGSDWVELDPRLCRQAKEILIKKPRASAFFDTPLLTYLIAHQTDTLIISGCSTSGCVRCTAESAINYNFHTIVVGDLVTDRSRSAHEANLFDIDSRLADVVPAEEVKVYLKALKR